TVRVLGCGVGAHQLVLVVLVQRDARRRRDLLDALEPDPLGTILGLAGQHRLARRRVAPECPRTLISARRARARSAREDSRPCWPAPSCPSSRRAARVIPRTDAG